MTLRPYQQKALDGVRAAYAAGRRAVLLQLPTGGGKCLGPEVTVLHHDGRQTTAEDVRPGDQLMGPDGTPRRVLTTTRGVGRIFRIVPRKGASWTCNDVHVLTLVHTLTGDVIDIPLDEYLCKTKSWKHLYKLFSPVDGVDFPSREAPAVDPYFLGVWFGDGTKTVGRKGLLGVGVSKPDAEILQTCTETARMYGLTVHTRKSGTCPTHRLVRTRASVPNALLDTIRGVVGPDLTVPDSIRFGSRETRRQFLAGFFDTDGHAARSGCEIVQKRSDYADALAFIGRSLGFRVSRSTKVVNEVTYHRLHINGDLASLPMRIARKLPTERRQKKVVTRTGFAVEPMGEGPYFGWELDRDGRFLLGDFTVTHNTHIAADLLRSATAKGRRAVFAAHRDDLLGDTVKRLDEAGIYVGRIQAGEQGNRLAPVQVCSLQTLYARPEEVPGADLVIVDEAHRAAAPTIRAVLERWPAARLLGLTATPERGDGKALGDVFDHLVMGPTTKELVEAGVLVPCDVVGPDSYRDELSMRPEDAVQRYSEGRATVVFCATVAAARELAGVLPRAACVDGEMPIEKRREILQAYDAGEIQTLTNCLVLTEGWNAPRAEVCVLARGCQYPGTFLQIIGRVLRAAPEKSRALLVDLRGVVHMHGLPDEPRRYSLSGRAISPLKRLAPLRTCPMCAAVFVSAPTCPRCAHVFPPPPPAKVREREMHPISMVHAAKRADMRAYFDELVAEARTNGWKPTAVGMKFRARHGFWPPWRVPTIEVADARA